MKKPVIRLIIAALTLAVVAGAVPPDSYELRGKVRFPDGKPVKQGIVYLEGATSPFSSSTRIGPDGSFRFKDLDATAYRIQIVTRSGEMEQSIEIGPSSADGKGRIDLTFEFEPHLHMEETATVSLKQLSVPDKARKEYGKAIEALEERKPDEAIEHLQKALVLAPHFSEASNRLGTISYMSKDYDQAETYFREALKHAPDSYPPLVNLGAALLSQGELEEALDVNRRAVQMRPQDPLARSQLGQTYWSLGRSNPAIRELKLAKELDSGHFSYPQLVLAEIYFQSNEHDAAAVELEEFLQEHPDSPLAQAVRESLNRLRSRQSP